MKRKTTLIILSLLALTIGTLTGCASGTNAGSTDTTKEAEATADVAADETEAPAEETAEDKTITVGAVVTPHAEILAVIKDKLAAEGYTLNVVEYNDYVLPNTALESGELDANYFQHQPYLDNFNEEKGTHLVSVAAVHYEPFGIYPGKTASLDDLKEGAKVAVPNDTTNEARALLLLESAGLIKLKEGAGLAATAIDIVENPLNLKIVELEAAQITRTLPDVDIASINGNYAIEAGFTVKDALVIEKADSLAAQTYANIIAVREGDEDSDKTKALVKAILSDEVKDFINNTYNDQVVPIF